MQLRAIAIDHGHHKPRSGAYDPKYNIDEANANYNVAVMVDKGLSRHGIKSLIITSQGENVELRQRAVRAREWGADMLLSIHHNGGGGDGYEIYCSTKPESGELANLIATEFKAVGQNPHGNKAVSVRKDAYGSQYYCIIRECDARGIPSMITEFAYVDSKDVEIIDTLSEQEKEAKAIIKAICKWCDVAYKDFKLM